MREIFLVCIAVLLTACAQNPNGELQRSINNRIISSVKASDVRRHPLYNPKYIERAKKNVDTNNYELHELDPTEPDETEDPARDNLAAYQQMLELDRMRKILNKRKKNGNTLHEVLNSPKIDDNKSKNDTENREILLKKQLEEMKLMLQEVQEKLSAQSQGGRCIIDLNGAVTPPTDQNISADGYKKALKTPQGMCKVMPGEDVSHGKICYPK